MLSNNKNWIEKSTNWKTSVNASIVKIPEDTFSEKIGWDNNNLGDICLKIFQAIFSGVFSIIVAENT